MQEAVNYPGNVLISHYQFFLDHNQSVSYLKKPYGFLLLQNALLKMNVWDEAKAIYVLP